MNSKTIFRQTDEVEKAENQEEAKKIIKDAGMELTDEEMNQVAGGKPPFGFHEFH